MKITEVTLFQKFPLNCHFGNHPNNCNDDPRNSEPIIPQSKDANTNCNGCLSGGAALSFFALQDSRGLLLYAILIEGEPTLWVVDDDASQYIKWPFELLTATNGTVS